MASEPPHSSPRKPSDAVSEPVPTPDPPGSEKLLEGLLESPITAVGRSLLSQTIKQLAADNRPESRLVLRWLRELRERRAGDITFQALHLDRLNEEVTAAIIAAEQLQHPSEEARQRAWDRVYKAELAIATELPPSDEEGRIARKGAVRAAIRADRKQVATYLAKRYADECRARYSADHWKLEAELKSILESMCVDKPADASSKPAEAPEAPEATPTHSSPKAPQRAS